MSTTPQIAKKYSRVCRFAYVLALGSRSMDVLSILAIAAGMNVLTGLIPPGRPENLLYQRHAFWEILLILTLCGGGILIGYLAAFLRRHLEAADKAVDDSKELGDDAVPDEFEGHIKKRIVLIVIGFAAAFIMLVAGGILAYQLMVGRV